MTYPQSQPDQPEWRPNDQPQPQPYYQPEQQPYPPQSYYPPPPPRKKRNTGLIVVVVVLGVLVACGGLAVIGAAFLTSGAGILTNESTQTNQTVVGMNQPGRDGKFEFTVTKVECGLQQIGSDILGEKAQGQFCLVHITVKNIGNEARTFTSGSQYAYNAAGQKYDANTSAAIYLEGDSRSFLEDINPGNSVNGVVVFDIPASASITKLELHDSGFSNGVIVNVT